MKVLRQVGEGLNAFSFKFEDHLLDEIRASYEKHVKNYLEDVDNSAVLSGGQDFHQNIIESMGNYYLVSYGKYPLLWISGNTQETHEIYKRFFVNLAIEDDVKALVDYKEDIVVYCGFFVVGNFAPAPNWHVDFFPNANAYTLITPLYNLSPAHGNLLYKLPSDDIKTYGYTLNEAIIFGDHFLHSTQPFQRSNNLRVMLSLTFGTDKMLYWDTLKKTIGHQSAFLVLPNGEWTSVT